MKTITYGSLILLVLSTKSLYFVLTLAVLLREEYISLRF